MCIFKRISSWARVEETEQSLQRELPSMRANGKAVRNVIDANLDFQAEQQDIDSQR
jgi:hypothetical protein